MILFLQIFSLLLTHDIHLTKAQVEVNPAEEAVQVSMHIFLDDLEKVIQAETGFTETMHLGTEKEVPEGDSLLAIYLSNHFLISANEQPLSFSFVGKENSQDLLAVWCYFEFPLSDIPTKNLTLTNNVLMELYDDQQNIITLQGPNKKRDYLLFQVDEPTASFNY